MASMHNVSDKAGYDEALGAAGDGVAVVEFWTDDAGPPKIEVSQ
jgi:hypothetical protein